MKYRSSIFNFESLSLRGFRPVGVMAALVLLMLFDLAVARRDTVWSWFPRSQSGIVDVLESKVIAKAQHPMVLVMGSSRIRDAVIPRRLAQNLGLPDQSVLNLGLTAGTPFDALMLYQRNRRTLSRAQWLVLGVEDWYVNTHRAPNQRDRRFAGLQDRVGIFTWPDTLKLLLGWVWRTYDARVLIHQYVSRWDVPSQLTLPISEDGRVVWRQEELDIGPDAVKVSGRVEYIYKQFIPGMGRLRQLRRLIERAQEDGLQVMIIQLPLRDAYIDQVQAKHGWAYQAYRDLMKSFADTLHDCPVYMFEKASEIGMPPNYFYDYGHMTVRGAEVMTDRLAQLMRDEFAIPQGAATTGLD